MEPAAPFRKMLRHCSLDLVGAILYFEIGYVRARVRHPKSVWLLFNTILTYANCRMHATTTSCCNYNYWLLQLQDFASTVLFSRNLIYSRQVVAVTSYCIVTTMFSVMTVKGCHYFMILAILLLTSLVTFPVGFDAPEVRQVCGAQSGLYNAASCHIGWSYIISCGCCALCFTLPVLSHYVTYMPKYNNLT